MAHNLPSPQIKLYVWPSLSLWELPSFDPYSLSAILYLQLAIPGKFSVIECTDPDLSPSGQLPFLVHGQECIASYSSIVKYITKLAEHEASLYPRGDVDGFLTPSMRSQRNAWLAHVEANLGNLVASALFASQENWEGLTLRGLSSLYPVPQRYFVPQKLRDAYKPRLESAGLWTEALPEDEEKKKTPLEKKIPEKPSLNKKKFLLVFQRDKFMEKAKPVLDIYSRLLGKNEYIFGNQISSLDVALASRILLLAKPPYPETTIKDLLTVAYPGLLAHAERVSGRLLASQEVPIRTEPHKHSIASLLPSGPFSFRSILGQRKVIEKTEEEKHIDRMRWGFVGLVVGSMCAYIAVLGWIHAPAFQAAYERHRQLRSQLAEEDEDED